MKSKAILLVCVGTLLPLLSGYAAPRTGTTSLLFVDFPPSNIINTSKYGACANVPPTPEVVAITRSGEKHCTGTIIRPNVVLTSAHCVYGLDSKQLKVILESRSQLFQRTYSIAKFVVNPGYEFPRNNPNFSEHDLALLFLERPYCSPIGVKLPRGADDGRPSSSDKLRFVGYGATSTGKEGPSGVGEKAWVDMATRDAARYTFEYGNERTNTCRGDSGGPALAKDRSGKYTIVFGVISAGDEECKKYGLFTRVDAHLRWINESINSLPSPECKQPVRRMTGPGSQP